jgi:CheY-like chemotaxis protein
VATAAQPLVLVIDPDPISLLGTAATLHGRGFEVHCSQSPEAALKAARLQPLDLIISDVDVEGTSGIEIVSAIHELPERGDVPAMFLSAAQMPDVISRRFRNGSAFFLRRPFDPALFLDLVDKALWMPHLVKTHINRPHISLGANAGFNTAPAATTARSH